MYKIERLAGVWLKSEGFLGGSSDRAALALAELGGRLTWDPAVSVHILGNLPLPQSVPLPLFIKQCLLVGSARGGLCVNFI